MNRTEIIDFINNNLPNNFTKDISPEDLNVVLKVLNNNSFNITSEERNAFNTIYDDGNLVDWNVLPTEVQSALEELVGRIKVIETQDRDANTAYVNYTTGNDLTANVGNKKKPFKTLQAALNLVNGSSYVKIVYVGGGTTLRTSVEVVNITRNNIEIDLGSWRQDKLRLKFTNCNNITLNLKGCYWENSESFYNLDFDNCSNVRILGGTLNNSVNNNGCLIIRNNCTNVFLKNVSIYGAVNKLSCTLFNTICYNCVFKHNASTTVFTALLNGSNNEFYNCSISSPTFALYQDVGTCKLYNSKIVGTIIGYDMSFNFNNCILESDESNIAIQNNSAIYMSDCQMKTNNFNIETPTLTNSYVSIIKNSVFVSNNGPFLEKPINDIIGARVYSINNVYNKNFTPNTVDEQRIFEYNKVVLTDLILQNTATFV